jgi:hypothetical protein
MEEQETNVLKDSLACVCYSWIRTIIENPEGEDGKLRLPPADEAVARYKNWVTALAQWAQNRRLATTPGASKELVQAISQDSLEIWKIMLNQSIYTAVMYAITFKNWGGGL